MNSMNGCNCFKDFVDGKEYLEFMSKRLEESDLRHDLTLSEWKALKDVGWFSQDDTVRIVDTLTQVVSILSDQINTLQINPQGQEEDIQVLLESADKVSEIIQRSIALLQTV